MPIVHGVAAGMPASGSGSHNFPRKSEAALDVRRVATAGGGHAAAGGLDHQFRNCWKPTTPSCARKRES
jgi:hypothetical protein